MTSAPLRALGFMGLWFCDYRRGVFETVGSDPTLELCLDGDGLGFTTGSEHVRIHPDDAKWLATERARSVGPSGWGVVEYRVIDEQGNVRWVMCRARYERDADGTLLTGRGVMFDVTDSVGESNGALRAPAAMANPLQQLIDSVLVAYDAARQMNDAMLLAPLRLTLETAGRRLARQLLEETPAPSPARKFPSSARMRNAPARRLSSRAL